MNSVRPWMLTLLAGAALAAMVAHPVCAEPGWTEAEYAKHFGPATRSPLTPDQARFAAPGGGSLLVVFTDGHSVEECWQINRDPSFIPPDLMARARTLVQGTAVRRVEFQLKGAPPAVIFEDRHDGVTLQVDTRNTGILRILTCREPHACTLLDRLLATERQTDELMARTQAQMRKEEALRRQGAK